MNTTANYFPHAIFATQDKPTPRVLVAPQRYIQGPGVLDQMGKYLSLIDARRVGILVSKRGQQADGVRVVASLDDATIEHITSTFNGECSHDEIDLHVSRLQGESLDCLIAMGGGKCVDAGKSIAF